MRIPEIQTGPLPISRRRVLQGVGAAGALLAAGGLVRHFLSPAPRTRTFIGRARDYHSDLASVLGRGLRELGIGPAEIEGKSILLKPNLVEPHLGAGHINTHPQVVRAAAQSFLRLGAGRVIVGEGPGHRRDTLLVLEESGLQEVLAAEQIPFVDLNQQPGFEVPNRSGRTRFRILTFPQIVGEVDWVVSLAKLKTHHWTGVTLSMKNLFGVMPGIYYGWPKNLLHQEGLEASILDITASLEPDFAIVDGIVGMEGDGPIMGAPRHAGVLIMGRNLVAVDATSARVMGLDPARIPYLAQAAGWLGPIAESAITQVGERPERVRVDFALIDRIPAHRGIRLGSTAPVESPA